MSIDLRVPHGEGLTLVPDVVYERDGYTSIPDTPLFVTMRNDFWTGLPLTGDRVVIDVFPCASRKQAEAVVRYANEPLLQMSEVRIVEEAPPPAPHRVLVVRSPARVRSWARDAPPP